MQPTKFKEANSTLRGGPAGEFQTAADVGDLPVRRTRGEYPSILSCWRASWRERLSVLLFGRVWLRVAASTPHAPVSVFAMRSAFEPSRGSRWLPWLGFAVLFVAAVLLAAAWAGAGVHPTPPEAHSWHSRNRTGELERWFVDSVGVLFVETIDRAGRVVEGPTAIRVGVSVDEISRLAARVQYLEGLCSAEPESPAHRTHPLPSPLLCQPLAPGSDPFSEPEPFFGNCSAHGLTVDECVGLVGRWLACLSQQLGPIVSCIDVGAGCSECRERPIDEDPPVDLDGP